MKLYLSSYHLGNKSKRLADMLSSNKKTTIICNAVDNASYQERKMLFQEEFNDLYKLGLDGEELDLREYFGEKEKLKDKLSQYSFVWVRGGNVFVLRRAMNESGLDKAIKEKINDNNFVYAGYSAGACVLSPSLKGYEIVDNPHIVSKGYKPEIVWDGLDIIKYYIAPHYLSAHPESSAIEKMVQYFIKNKLPYKTLQDGNVIIETT